MITVIFFGCGAKNDKSETYSEIRYISTGGVACEKLTCPSEVNDVIVDLKTLNPSSKNDEPEMTIASFSDFQSRTQTFK